jgi:hypothetical protein
MDTTVFEFEIKEGPSLGGPDMGSTEGSGNRELRCTEAPQGATGQDPVSVSLAEKVSTLGFQKTKKDSMRRCQETGEEGEAGRAPWWGTCWRRHLTISGWAATSRGNIFFWEGEGLNRRLDPLRGHPVLQLRGTGGNRQVQVSAKGCRGHSRRQAG